MPDILQPLFDNIAVRDMAIFLQKSSEFSTGKN
jgi:hypothetical protein